MKTQETVTQYAAFAKRKDGTWFKIHTFTFRSKRSAELAIYEFKQSLNGQFCTEYKIMQREHTTIIEDWSEV